MFSVNCFVLGRKDEYEGKTEKNANCSCVFMQKRKHWNLKWKKKFY